MGNLTVKESGEMVNIISPNVSNITSFKVHFSPRQEGSGDPSPENVREIVGWNGVEGYISNVAQPYSSTSNTLTAAIDWTEDIGTIYGGYVDLISGELVQTWQLRQISELDIKKTSGTGIWEHRFDMKYWVTGYGYEATGAFKCLADCFTLGLADHNNSFLTYAGNISVYDDTVSTADEFKAKYGQNYVAYEIKSDLWQTHQLSPQQLSTLKGQNNFWSNADYIEIEYELTETFDIQKAKRKIILNQPHVESASGDLVTFDTDMKGKLKECKVSFLPVQEGEGDPSPDNVRNITGWSWVKLSTGQQNIYGNTKNILRKIYIPAGTTWTASCDGGGTVYIYDAYKKIQNSWAINGIDEISGRRYKTITVSSYDIYYVRIVGNACQNPQFEFGALSEYEPVIENSITFPSDAGTVYGGYVDLVSGELVATHLAFIMDGVNHKVSTGAAVNTNNNMARGHAFMGRTGGLENLPLGKNNTGLYAINKYVIHGMENGAGDTAAEGIYCGTGTPYVRVVVSVNDLADVSETNAILNSINEWLTNNPVQVCYTLAEPIHYQLTPQQLITLRGINNVYSNTNGQTEIKYWKH